MMHFEKMMKKIIWAQLCAPKILFVCFTSTGSYTLFQVIILCNLREN